MTLGGVRGGVCFGGQKEKKEKRKVKRETNYYINDVTTANAARQFSVMVCNSPFC